MISGSSQLDHVGVAHEAGREGQAGIDVLGFQAGVLTQDLLPALSGAQKLEDRLRGDPLASDRGLSIADRRVDGNATLLRSNDLVFHRSLLSPAPAAAGS